MSKEIESLKKENARLRELGVQFASIAHNLAQESSSYTTMDEPEKKMIQQLIRQLYKEWNELTG